MNPITAVSIGTAQFGGDGLAVIAGPCAAESAELCLTIARELDRLSRRLGFGCVFKASFDKANRSKLDSYRGPGLAAGLEILKAVRDQVGLPVLTDVHEPGQVDAVAAVVDAIQVPAFLCRQTDLLIAAGESGKPVLMKKGQFMAPWDMEHAVNKVKSTDNDRIILVERGACFGYSNLVSDMRSIVIMRGLGRPVVFDATHSAQLPGAAGGSSGGQREMAPVLAKAAVAAGADGVFLETHPEPTKALSDSSTMLPLDSLGALMRRLLAIYAARDLDGEDES